MRVVFAGTPDFSVPCLEALYRDGNTEVIAVYTQPDRPAGRGKKLQQSPIKDLALSHETPVYQPLSFRSAEELDRLKQLSPDLMVVTAYGMILPQAVLDIPILGCVNVHASLLPRWRGAAPIQRAIEAGDAKTGVTLMQMEAGLDTGPMLATIEMDIAENETGGSLHDRLSSLGGELLARNLQALADQSLIPVSQKDEQACYARKLSKSESALDWRLSADSLQRKIRAFNPWPMATANFENIVLRVHEATVLDGDMQGKAGGILSAARQGIVVQTGQGWLSLQVIQKPGGKPMTAAAFLNGSSLCAGMSFNPVSE